MAKEILLEPAPIEEFLMNLAMEVSKCDSKDTIIFDTQFLTNLRDLVLKDSNLNKDSSYLSIEVGSTLEGKIKLKTGFELNFIRTKLLNNNFVLRDLSINKYPYFSYYQIRYPNIDYHCHKHFDGAETYELKICC